MVLELIHEFNRCKVYMQGFITALCSSKDKPNCIKKSSVVYDSIKNIWDYIWQNMKKLI